MQRVYAAILLVLVMCLGLVVSPVFANSAFDVEGTTDDSHLGYNYYEEIVKYAAGRQREGHYTIETCLQPEVDPVFKHLKTDNIYFYNGHCSPGIMKIKYNEGDTKDFRFIFAEGEPQLKGLGLPYMQFVFFDCCESAKPDKTYGNLIKTAVDEGAKCAFGFQSKIDAGYTAILYGQTFWHEAKRGTTWNFCHKVAVETIKRDPRAKEMCTKENSFCGYDTLDSVGGRACSSIMAPPRPETDEMIEPTETIDSVIIQPLEFTNLTLDQAQEIIREFTGNPNLNATYEKPDYSPNVYKFTADNSSFYINSITHRVEDTTDFDPEDILIVKPGIKEVSLDEAYVIAENFAKSRCPQFWNIAPGKTGVKLMRKYTQDHGSSGYENVIGWREEYYYPDKHTPGYITVNGLKNIYISVAPDGEIYSYDEDLTPRDESVSLKPNITEDQAWDIAKKYALSKHNITLADNDKTSHELVLRKIDTPPGSPESRDRTEVKQHLVWCFEAANKYNSGGRISVDAHDGQVVLYSPYM